MSEVQVQPLEPGIFLIDQHFLGLPGVIASYLVAGGDGLALIETGPSTTSETLLAGVRQAGYDPEAITHLLVTHIHLDHAGAAGSLLRRLPRARLYVHPVGAPHLVDPSKLLASAGRIYGDAMQRLWGEVLPVPAARLHALADGETVDLGRVRLQALETPGHAYHHHAYHDAERGLVFTGDVAGVRLTGVPHVRPPTPPPELDLPAWRRSLLRLRQLRARRLLLTHFGASDEPDWHLDDLLAHLYDWAGWLEARLRAGLDRERLVAELRARGDAELHALVGGPQLDEAFEAATNYPMSVDGFLRYFRKQAERRAKDEA